MIDLETNAEVTSVIYSVYDKNIKEVMAVKLVQSDYGGKMGIVALVTHSVSLNQDFMVVLILSIGSSGMTVKQTYESSTLAGSY